MSIHPSLGKKGKSGGTRSVLNRRERVNELKEKEKWQMGDSVFGLAKVKTLRWKVKKAKKAVDQEGTDAKAAEPTAKGTVAKGAASPSSGGKTAKK